MRGAVTYRVLKLAEKASGPWCKPIMVCSNSITGGPIPPAGRDVLAALAGDGAVVVAARTFAGSFSNYTCLVRLRTRRGTMERVVLRRFSVEGEIAARRAHAEFGALKLLRGSGVPVPDALYLDPTGEVLGRPGLVTSFIEGRQVYDPENTSAWARALASALASIHSVRYEPARMAFLFDGNHIGTWFLRDEAAAGQITAAPGGEDVIRQVRGLYASLAPDRPSLIHVDFWPGNVLWDAGRISAVVDWEEASYGDPAFDLGYLRANIARRGLDKAGDDLLEAYEAETGAPVKNLGLWELSACARAMPNVSVRIANERMRSFIEGARRRAGL